MSATDSKTARHRKTTPIWSALRRCRSLQRRAGAIVAERLWAASSDGRASFAALSALRGAYSDRRCFVIGNGPSLTMADLEAIKDEVSIASNGIFLAFEDSSFRPTYYTVEDRLVAEDRATEISKIERVTKIIPVDLRTILAPSPETISVWFRRSYNAFPLFSTDLSSGAFFGGTVTYLNLQLAFHLGCPEVYLIGVDHSYQVPETSSHVITSSQADVNHFHQDYFGPGYRWHDPKVERMELAYGKARVVFESQGRQVLNATRGGELTVFPRVSLDSLLSSEAGQ